MNLLIVGVGNPILGDDAAGIHVARAIKDQLPPELLVDVKEVFTGGIDLAEELLGYESEIFDWFREQNESNKLIINIFNDDDVFDQIIQKSAQTEMNSFRNFMSTLKLFAVIYAGRSEE